MIGFQAPTMLTFTWNAPPHLSEARAQRTVVLLRFRPDDADEGTRVELTHLGWGEGGEWDEAYDYFDPAWDGVLRALQTYFAGEDEPTRSESGPRPRAPCRAPHPAQPIPRPSIRVGVAARTARGTRIDGATREERVGGQHARGCRGARRGTRRGGPIEVPPPSCSSWR